MPENDRLKMPATLFGKKGSRRDFLTMAPNPAPVSASAAAEAMDRMHEAGVKAFPAKTAGTGNQLMKPRMDKGVK